MTVGQVQDKVGSTFKPFVYATAIEQLNMSPCEFHYRCLSQCLLGATITEAWTPETQNNKYIGMVTLKKH
jgi:penicillin-binding protein 1A